MHYPLLDLYVVVDVDLYVVVVVDLYVVVGWPVFVFSGDIANRRNGATNSSCFPIFVSSSGGSAMLVLDAR